MTFVEVKLLFGLFILSCIAFRFDFRVLISDSFTSLASLRYITPVLYSMGTVSAFFAASNTASL